MYQNMAARSDLQNSSSNYGLFRLPPSNTMLKNHFVSSAKSNVHSEDDTIRQRRPSSDSARNMTLLRLDSTGNELNKQVKLDFEMPGKSSPSSFVEAICGCVQLSVLSTDVKKDYCMMTCNNYLSRDSSVASFSSLSQFSATKSTILHDFNRCLMENQRVLPKCNASRLATLAHENMVSFNRNMSINLTAGDLTTDKNTSPSKILEQEVSSGEVVLTLEERFGQEQGFPKDSNMSVLAQVPDMDSGNFSAAEDWEDLDTEFVDCDSEICTSDGGRHSVTASDKENIGRAKEKDRDYTAENQSSKRNMEPSDSKKEANTDIPRKHCRILPCLLRAASQRYIRGMCFMTRQSSVELDKNESCLIKALKHVPCKQDLHELLKIRRKNETGKKRKSAGKSKSSVVAESSDSGEDDCYETEDDSDIKSPEKMPPVQCSGQNSNKPRQNTVALYHSQFYCPLSLSDSSSSEESSSDDDEDTGAWGSSATVSSFAPIATCFMTNFFGSSCSLLWQTKTVQCSAEASSSEGQQPTENTSGSDQSRSSGVDNAEKIEAELSRIRMLPVNEAWSKIYPDLSADQTNATSSFSSTVTTIHPEGQCNVVRVCKKVHFCSKEDTVMPILNRIQWAEEYESARIGPWIQMGLDRNRFQRHIAEVEAIVSPILTPEHRSKVLLRL